MRLTSLLLGLTLVSAAACGDAGDYLAIQLTSPIDGVVTDQLSEGTTLSSALPAGGATTGHRFVPGDETFIDTRVQVTLARDAMLD